MRKLSLIISVFYSTSLQASMKNYRFHEDTCESSTQCIKAKRIRATGNFCFEPISQQPFDDSSNAICILSMDPVIDQLFKFGIPGIHKINRKYFFMGTGYDASESTKTGFPLSWRPSRILNNNKVFDLVYSHKAMTYLRGHHRKVDILADLPTYILSSMISTCTDMPEQDWQYLCAMNISHFKVTQINFIPTLEKSRHFASKLLPSRVRQVSFAPDSFGRDYMEYVFHRLPRLFGFVEAIPRQTLETLTIDISFLPVPAYIDELVNQVLFSSIKQTQLTSSTLSTSQIRKILQSVNGAWFDPLAVRKIDDQQPCNITIVSFSDHLRDTPLSELYINAFTNLVYIAKPFKILKQFTYRSKSKFINGKDIFKMCRRRVKEGRPQKLYQKNCIADQFLEIATQHFKFNVFSTEDLDNFIQSNHLSAQVNSKANPLRCMRTIRNLDVVYLNFINTL